MTEAPSDAPVYAAGPAPSRSTASLTLSLGMVMIPVSVYSGIERPANAVPRHKYTAEGDEVGMRPYNKRTLESVEADQIVTKATASDGTLVELTDDEIVSIAGVRDGQASIEVFIPLESLYDGTYIVEAFHQVRPAKSRVGTKKIENAPGGKAYNLLLGAMAQEKVAGLVHVALRGQPRYAAILPDGRLAILAFAEQVRASLPLPSQQPSAREMEMALALVRSVGTERPVLGDVIGTALQEFVDVKAAADGEVSTDEKPAPVEAPMDDLMAAMARSLGMAVPAVESADPALAPEQNPPELVDEPVVEPAIPEPAPAPTGLGSIVAQAKVRALRAAS